MTHRCKTNTQFPPHVILHSVTERTAHISCAGPNTTSSPYTATANCHQQTRSKCLSFKLPCLSSATWKRQLNTDRTYYGVFWRHRWCAVRSWALSRNCEKQVIAHTLLTYLLTYSVEQRVLLEKLTGLQLLKKLPAFYGTRRFISAFTSALPRVPIISQLNPVQTQHPTSWWSI
jgi:hypothetical protein